MKAAAIVQAALLYLCLSGWKEVGAQVEVIEMCGKWLESLDLSAAKAALLMAVGWAANDVLLTGN